MPRDPRAIESLLAFWTSAGVDTLHGEEPFNRTLASPRAAATRQAPGTAATETPAIVTPASRTPPPSPAREEPAEPSMIQAPAVDSGAVEAARLAAAAADDLDALAIAIAAFDGCTLKGGARQAVFSRGRPDAPVMIIGEAPGAEEDAKGSPFVGRAGQLLDKMLAAAGLNERVFITNTVFWRPPGNRTPFAAEQAACAPFLERAIALVKPKVLLLVGGASAKAMLKKNEGILSLRGRWFEWKSRDETLEIPALPTLHPSFLLRQPIAKRKGWEDLLILTERLDRPSRPG